MDNYFDRLTSEVNKSLLNGIECRGSFLEEVICYSLSVKGKRMRPLLFLTLIDAFNGNISNVMDIACAIEYIHTYSLIHDDLPVMDDDDFRRGMPTVHKKFNESIALLAGDTLLSLAFERISISRISELQMARIIWILTSSIGINGMAGGQALDLEFKGEKQKIFRIHRMKTAELIKGTMLSAAEILNLTENQKKLLRSAGIFIGIAFQMADDLLDIEGDEKEVGKKIHKDKINQSPNSVIYYGKDFVASKIDYLYRKTLDRLHKAKIDYPPFMDLIRRMAFRSK
jgi:geranylgeranyl diphosphate synthase type II